MNIILSVILISLFIFGLQWFLQHLLSELRVEKLERLFQALEKSTSKQLENLKDLIRAYYKASGTTMDIDLSKKGLKQLEYIYQDIYNTLSSSNNGLEGKLYFLKMPS